MVGVGADLDIINKVENVFPYKKKEKKFGMKRNMVISRKSTSQKILNTHTHTQRCASACLPCP